MASPPGALQRELQVAQTLAEAAGALAMAHYSRPFAVDYKNEDPGNPVTAADRAVNALIVDGLRAAFPDDAILAEESPDTAERRGARRLWCVDPIDGTREFVAKNGDFVVMIGLAIDGAAALGVLLHPPTQALLWGAPGQAKRRQRGVEQPLAVSAVAELEAATAVISRAHPSRAMQRVLDGLHVSRRLPIGSVGLKLARIAGGAAEIYMTGATRMQEWDACAPEAVLRAAGGQVTDATGAPLTYNKADPVMPQGILATNGALHPACLAALAPLAAARGWRAGGA